MKDHGLKQVGLSIGTRKLFIRNHQMRKAGWKSKKKYQLSEEGGTRSPPATPHRLQSPNVK